MKKVFYSSIILLLVLSTGLFLACKKQNSVSSTNNNSSTILKSISKEYKGGAKSIINNYHKTDAPDYNCPEVGGNCLGTVTIKPKDLCAVFPMKPLAVQSFFTGTNWHQYFTQEVIDDEVFVNYMVSGNAHILKVELVDKAVFFIGDENVDESNAQYVIPCEK